MREERFEVPLGGMRLAARPPAVLADRHRPPAEKALTEELPWLHWLPESERHSCVRELPADLIAGAGTGLLPFARSLASWRSTAEAWSDPQVVNELQVPFTGDAARSSPDRAGRPRDGPRRGALPPEGVGGTCRRPTRVRRVAAVTAPAARQPRPGLGSDHQRTSAHTRSGAGPAG